MKSYTRDQVVESTLKFFNGNTLATDVVVEKYLLRDDDKFYELNPEDMIRNRIAKEIHRAESKYRNAMSYEEVLSYLLTPVGESNHMLGPIMFQGSPMAAMGNNFQIQSLSNCFVIDGPEDSYGGIMHTDQEQVQIMKRRGGVGFNLSKLRPKGMCTKNAARTTDGVTSFMNRFSNTCREVAQGGRRGALMLCASCKHPDIEYFINIKRDKKLVTGANISVMWTDDFFDALLKDGDFTLQWPVDVPVEEAKYTKVVKAKDIWEQFVDAAWFSAEPGSLFLDTIRKMTPSDAYEALRSVATNPCSEICMPPNSACRLAYMNVAFFVRHKFKEIASFDFVELYKTAYVAQKFLDNMIDLEYEAVEKIIAKIKADPEADHLKRVEIELWEKINKRALEERRTGLGTTAVGDAIAMMGLKYGSVESIAFVDEMYKTIALASYRSSVDMARDRGAFELYDYETEKDHPFIRQIISEDAQLEVDYKAYGRRNVANTTTAPVGSGSTVCQYNIGTTISTETTSGIEPAIFLSYDRKRKIAANEKADFVDAMGDSWQIYKVYHSGMKAWKDVTGETDDTLSPYYGSTASDIDPLNGVKLQAAAQKWICHAISKTANLPQDVKREVVGDLYLSAWKNGCKGFTVYRHNSRVGVITESGTSTDEDDKQFFEGLSTSNIIEMYRIAQKYKENMPKAYMKKINSNVNFIIEMRAQSGDKEALAFVRTYKPDFKEGYDNAPDEYDLNATRPQSIVDVHAPKRPKELECDIHHVKVKGESYIVLVGMLNGRPYEVFCGLSNKIELAKNLNSGKIVKAKTAKYDLVIGKDESELVFHDIIDLFDNPVYGSLTRHISLSLRHGIPIKYVVEQLKKKDKHSDITSFSAVIARVFLKDYSNIEGEVVKGVECDSCGGGPLVYQEGCMKCTQCNASKCG